MICSRKGTKLRLQSRWGARDAGGTDVVFGESKAHQIVENKVSESRRRDAAGVKGKEKVTICQVGLLDI